MGKSMENQWKINWKSMENKNGKKEMFLWYSLVNRKMTIFGGCPGSRLFSSFVSPFSFSCSCLFDPFFRVSFFGTLIGFVAPEMVPWLSKTSEDQSAGPKTNLEVFGAEVSFQYFPKTRKLTSPCHVRQNPAKVRGNRFVWSMPCPRTPPDLSNIISNCQKNSFL